MPIWLAYVVTPVLLLLFAGKVILGSESPLLLVAIMVSAGLICAAVLHAYIAIKGKLTQRPRK